MHCENKVSCLRINTTQCPRGELQFPRLGSSTDCQDPFILLGSKMHCLKSLMTAQTQHNDPASIQT